MDEQIGELAKLMTPEQRKNGMSTLNWTKIMQLQNLGYKVLNYMKEKSVLNNLGTPEDGAYAYTFLASDKAKFITGTVLSVGGGVVVQGVNSLF